MAVILPAWCRRSFSFYGAGGASVSWASWQETREVVSLQGHKVGTEVPDKRTLTWSPGGRRRGKAEEKYVPISLLHWSALEHQPSQATCLSVHQSGTSGEPRTFARTQAKQTTGWKQRPFERHSALATPLLRNHVPASPIRPAIPGRQPGLGSIAHTRAADGIWSVYGTRRRQRRPGDTSHGSCCVFLALALLTSELSGPTGSLLDTHLIPSPFSASSPFVPSDAGDGGCVCAVWHIDRRCGEERVRPPAWGDAKTDGDEGPNQVYDPRQMEACPDR